MPNVPNSACRIGRRALKILTAALLGGVALVGGVALLAVPSTYSAVQTVPSVPRPPSVSVMQAGTGTLVDTILVTGTLVARDEVLVSSEIEGLTIVELLADEGDRVLRGQVLARLSSAALEAQLAQTSASTDRAVATIAQVKSQIAEAE